MDTHPKHLPADERRAVTVESVVALAGSQNPSEITTAAIAKYMNLTQGALFRHFPNKESLLVELLVGISTRLLAGAREVQSREADAAAALDGLIDFHLDFALGEPDLIRIQDRDLTYLPDAAERQVRRAQRQYVEVWVGVLRQVHPGLAETDARLMAHAAFGLLNSTPHSLRPDGIARSHAVMRAMTVAALTVGASPV